MPRRPIQKLTDPGNEPGFWSKRDAREEYQKQTEKRRQEDEHMKRYDKQQGMAQRLPKSLQDKDMALDAIDRLVDAEAYLRSDTARTQGIAALGLGGATLAAKAGADYLGAHNQQQVDSLPTDFISVAGRMANPGVANGYASGVVGADPLALARNRVSEAHQLVNSEAVLEALLVDEVNALQANQSKGASLDQIDQMNVIQQAVDRRAKQLQAEGEVRNADGSVTPMSWDDAQRFASNQVELDLRAAGIL